ncbi:MAG: twin-arginine translocase TatA/TatE family subunit [Chloroflexota bacterium]|nr:twin-arginine translocase TatA/TatE family subunit [Chloroflexota bacterium]
MPIGFHPVELIAILAIALLVFGPKRLPEMGASIGKSIKEFQKGMRELNEPKEETSSAASLAAIERGIASKRAAAAAEIPASEVDSKGTKID